MTNGIIVKTVSEYYYVQDDITGKIIACKGRGILRKNNTVPLVGDYVKYSYDQDGQSMLESIHRRKNEIFRPKVANIDQTLLVFTIYKPSWNQKLLDRFIVMAEYVNVEIVIVLNKIDSLSKEQLLKLAEIKNIYQTIGYKVVETSALNNIGVDLLRDILKDKISIFAGQSGVGKSSLVNMLEPKLKLKTDQISKKLNRGKHTTRHVELFALSSGGFIVDTPGFSQLDLETIEDYSQLASLFKEISELAVNCKYRGCTHTSEDKCAVIDAVNNNIIDRSRYNNYLDFLNEIKDNNKYTR